MWKYGAQNINIHPHIVHPWGKIIPIWKVEITFLETLKYLSPCFFQSIMMHIIRLLVRDDGWHCNQWNQIPSFCTLSVTYAMFLIKKGWIFFSNGFVYINVHNGQNWCNKLINHFKRLHKPSVQRNYPVCITEAYFVERTEEVQIHHCVVHSSRGSLCNGFGGGCTRSRCFRVSV